MLPAWGLRPLSIGALLFFASSSSSSSSSFVARARAQADRRSLEEVESKIETLNLTNQLEVEEFAREWESALSVAGHRVKAGDPVLVDQRLDSLFGRSPARLRQRQGDNHCFQDPNSYCSDYGTCCPRGSNEGYCCSSGEQCFTDYKLSDGCCGSNYRACGALGSRGTCCDSEAACCAGSDGSHFCCSNDQMCGDTSCVDPTTTITYTSTSWYYVAWYTTITVSLVDDATSTITRTIPKVTTVSSVETTTITETMTSTITDTGTSSGRRRHAVPIKTVEASRPTRTQAPTPELEPPPFTLELRGIRSLDPLASLLAARGVPIRRAVSTETQWVYEAATSTSTVARTTTDWWSTSWEYEYEYVTDLSTSYERARSTVTLATTIMTHVAAPVDGGGGGGDDKEPEPGVGVDDESSLSPYAIAGIAVGVIGGLAVLGGALWWGFIFPRRGRKKREEEGSGAGNADKMVASISELE